MLEDLAVDVVLNSSDRIAQHTRIFRFISKRGLIHKMDNVPVRLADGTEQPLIHIKRRANEGQVGVFFGTDAKACAKPSNASSRSYRRTAFIGSISACC